MTLEVNWNGYASNGVRVKMGSKEAVFKLEDLFGFIFLSVSPEKQSELMPVRKTTITKYVRQHTVEAKKDIKRGEKIVVNCEIDVPTVVEEGLRGTILERGNSPILRL